MAVALQADPEERTSVEAELTAFAKKYWHTQKLYALNAEGDIEWESNAHVVTPMAQFTIINPESDRGKEIRIKFDTDIGNNRQFLRLLRKKKNLNCIFTFTVPSDYFEGEYGSIDSSYVEDLKKVRKRKE